MISFFYETVMDVLTVQLKYVILISYRPEIERMKMYLSENFYTDFCHNDDKSVFFYLMNKQHQVLNLLSGIVC